MKIAMFSTKPYDQVFFDEHNTDPGIEITYFEASLNIKTVSLARGYDAVCVFVNDKVDDETIQQLHQQGVRLICLRCAGFNNVDLQSAQKHNIKVTRVPAYSPEAVAEHTMALILTLNRKTHKAYNRVREGNFSLNRLIGFNLYKKTVGVIGTGKVGAAFCRILMGFGCRVVAFDPYPNDALIQAGVQYLPFEELCKQSNIISLHCPLTEATHHIINQDAIKLMKGDVMLINTSRGGLINTADVVESLIDRKIGSLGIDVYEQEENLFFQDLSESIIQDELILRLNSFPNVLITSHQAFFTKEAMDEITKTTLENVVAFDQGKKLVNEISY